MKTFQICFVLAIWVFIQIQADENQQLDPFGLPLLRNIPERFIIKGDSRIFGGEEVKPHSIPYQVAMYAYSPNNVVMFCSGSIISKKYILTAAHCLWKQVRIEVILGGHDLKDLNDNHVFIDIDSENFIIHENFAYTVVDDIALIRFPNPIEFTDAIQPITLPTYTDRAIDFVGVKVVLSGWGKTESESLSQVLLKTKEEIITNDECVYYYGEKVKEDLHICTSGDNGRGPCNGDSGGPLVLDSKQIGIISFGPHWLVGCLNFNFPSGYTRITHHLEWIESHTDVNILYE